MTLDEIIKQWVVINSKVNLLPRKCLWAASVTICGYDEVGYGTTIEKAYRELSDELKHSQKCREYIIKNHKP